MVTNRVSINGRRELSWEVPDSKMEAVISVLDAVGGRVGVDVRQELLEEARFSHDIALSEEGGRVRGST